MRWQTGSCLQTQHNTAAVALLMAEPDTAVIQLKPSEESQCPTASPATCTITIKGYYRHSSILNIWNWRLTQLLFNSTLCPSVITSLHPYTIYQQFLPLHLSINVHITLFNVYAPIHHSFNLFHSILLLSSLCSSVVLICWLDTTLLPVFLHRNHILCFISNDVIIQLQMRAFFQRALGISQLVLLLLKN